MTPQEHEILARGYAWGHADASRGSVSGTQDGIAFGTAYRKHVESNSGNHSVQEAFRLWKESGKID